MTPAREHPQQALPAAGGTPIYPFVGVPTFLRAPLARSVADSPARIAVVGVPIDEGQPFFPGARFGARAIREQSLRFVSSPDGCFDPRTGTALLAAELAEGAIIDLGDIEVLTTDVETTFERITAAVADVLSSAALPVVLGGDHSITFPIARAFDGPIHVVQFDAHLDYAPIDGRLKHTNAHAFRHIAAMDSVERLVQVGIRSLRTSASLWQATHSDGNAVVLPEDLRTRGADAVLEHIPANARCYVSIDIDSLDASLVPGCVSGEPDGLSYAQLRDTLAALAAHSEIVGLDLVEVNPLVDLPHGPTAYLAANLIIALLGTICNQPRWRARSDEPA